MVLKSVFLFGYRCSLGCISVKHNVKKLTSIGSKVVIFFSERYCMIDLWIDSSVFLLHFPVLARLAEVFRNAQLFGVISA